jgi:hypothetical protein
MSLRCTFLLGLKWSEIKMESSNKFEEHDFSLQKGDKNCSLKFVEWHEGCFTKPGKQIVRVFERCNLGDKLSPDKHFLGGSGCDRNRRQTKGSFLKVSLGRKIIRGQPPVNA